MIHASEPLGRLIVGRKGEAVIEGKAPKVDAIDQLARWGDTAATVKIKQVWSHDARDHFIVFTVLALDQPLYLHKSAWMPYTHSSALAPKGHVIQVVEVALLNEYAEDNRRRFEALRAAENAQKDVDRLIAQLKHLKARARSGEDVSLEIRSVQKALDKKNRRAA